MTKKVQPTDKTVKTFLPVRDANGMTTEWVETEVLESSVKHTPQPGGLVQNFNPQTIDK